VVRVIVSDTNEPLEEAVRMMLPVMPAVGSGTKD
jgi:hypothetical protein